MLQLQVIRQNPEWVKERLAIKNFAQSIIVDEILKFDGQVRKLKSESENIQSKINSLSKEIGKHLKDESKINETVAIKNEVVKLNQELSSLKNALLDSEKELQAYLVLLPNIPSEKVPRGAGPEDNVVMREGGSKPDLPKEALPHWELAKKLTDQF